MPEYFVKSIYSKYSEICIIAGILLSCSVCSIDSAAKMHTMLRILLDDEWKNFRKFVDFIKMC